LYQEKVTGFSSIEKIFEDVRNSAFGFWNIFVAILLLIDNHEKKRWFF